jgi:hypothetical protein
LSRESATERRLHNYETDIVHIREISRTLDREHRNLNGQIDEMLILARPLQPGEIAEMAGTGPP